MRNKEILMILVNIMNVSLSNMGFVVFLRNGSDTDKRTLPIFIGATEAQAIALHLDRRSRCRAMAWASVAPMKIGRVRLSVSLPFRRKTTNPMFESDTFMMLTRIISISLLRMYYSMPSCSRQG